jgi:4-hydroxy-4-methyl-2-oxoglutarate aldolase
VVGGVTVESGDMVVGDEDGVVVVPQARIAEVITRLSAIRTAEAALEARVKAGLEIPDFLKALIEAKRFREIG